MQESYSEGIANHTGPESCADGRRDGAHQVIQCDHAAPVLSTTKAPAFGLSRLNHTALALAVYASSRESPRPDARLASGCRPALPDGLDP